MLISEVIKAISNEDLTLISKYIKEAELLPVGKNSLNIYKANDPTKYGNYYLCIQDEKQGTIWFPFNWSEIYQPTLVSALLTIHLKWHEEDPSF